MAASTRRPAGPAPGRWRLAAVLVAATATAAGSSPARADELEQRIAGYESEVRQLSADLPRPNQLTGAAGQRRLLDAEVAYSLGDYDRAALMLFDLAAKPGPDRETASFYLGESLFQKGDRGAARGYYEQVAAGGSIASKYYQPALERLVEIAIVQNDIQKGNPDLQKHLDALDRISGGLRLPSVPYVRGKLAYAQGNLDEAIGYFQDVPKGSEYEMQATYYMATTYVANKNVQRASDIFTDLIGRKPKSANDRRIVELSQLALGRLYYERDQPSKSIDSYLLVDRHSDLFPDALYEVSWVYVKSKQYDKALRALELLSLSDPQSTKTPTVRILEGNLRIRKAQLIRGAQIQGTLDPKSQDDPATEYDKAVQVFTETHDIYAPSYAALARIVDSGADPAQFLSQIAGRTEHVFQVAAPIPEAAVQYLRDEPEVQRVVAVEADLGEINANITETEATIARLEGVLGAADQGSAYPALAGRRARLEAIADELIKIRGDLAEQQLKLLDAAASSTPMTATRKQRLAAYAAMPNAAAAASERLTRTHEQYDAIEATATEIEATIGSTQAMAVALRKFSADTPDLPAEQSKAIASTLDDAAREAQAIEDQLAAAQRDLQIGRDLAGIGDDESAGARAARAELTAAEDAEHQALAGMVSTSRDREASQRLVALGDRATRLAAQIDQGVHQVDGAVDAGLAEIRGLLVAARAELGELRRELAAHEVETRSLGSAALGASFAAIKAKLYDIVIRTDVGNVDVSWSQKEDNDDDLKRLNLSRQRELKQLRDEFKDILDGGLAKPSAPAKKKEVMPQPTGGGPSGSPDKGAGEQRIAPVAGDKPASAAPAPVRPEDAAKSGSKKADPKKATPKKAGAAKGGSK